MGRESPIQRTSDLSLRYVRIWFSPTAYSSRIVELRTLSALNLNLAVYQTRCITVPPVFKYPKITISWPISNAIDLYISF
jgi:hypothetical protein